MRARATWCLVGFERAIGLIVPICLGLLASAQDPDCYMLSEHSTQCTPIPLCQDVCVNYSCGEDQTVWFEFDLASASDPLVIDVLGEGAFTYALWNDASCHGFTGSSWGSSDEHGDIPMITTGFSGHCFFAIHIPGSAEPCPGSFVVDVRKGPCGMGAAIDCAACFTPLSPAPGTELLLTAWTRMLETDPGISTYDLPGDDGPKITVQFTGSATIYTAQPSGPLIDQWQRMELSFVVPEDAESMSFIMDAGEAGPALFDDLRIAPPASSMKCFVYDPRTLRLSAELDERHFATFYEYDQEGRLARLKKETERGVMTLQEGRTYMPGIHP